MNILSRRKDHLTPKYLHVHGERCLIAKQFENWRIRPDLHREIGITAKQERVPMYELAERAWKAYVERLKDPKHDPLIEPNGNEEYKMVAALLVAMRDPQTWKYYASPIKALLETELRRLARSK